MEIEIIIFWAVAGILLVSLKALPPNRVSRAAFTWIGPKQTVGEKSYQFRWAAYSASWLMQILFVFSLLWLAVTVWPNVGAMTLWLVFWFALPIGGGMAALAAITFTLKGLKARYIGQDEILGSDEE